MQRQFPNVTPEQFAKFKAEAASHNIVVPDGLTGEVRTNGCAIDFNYDGVKELNLTITEKPWYLSADFIFSQLAPYLTA